MIIVEVNGGLGNQMFQFAAGKALALKFGRPLFLDLSAFENQKKQQFYTARPFELDLFNTAYKKLDSQTATNILHPKFPFSLLRKIVGTNIRIFKETKFSYNDAWNSLHPPVYLRGYWQTEKYFRTYKSTLRKEFSFKIPLDPVNEKLANDMRMSTSVSVHFRRGDYTSTRELNDFHGTPGVEYYEQAIKLIKSKYPQAIFYVFTDDPKWVKENFVSKHPGFILIGHNKNNDSWKDMCLMSFCQHNIIANSSFSWWGAWLNNNPQKVCIAPAKWFKKEDEFYNYNDIIPETWISLR